MVANQHIQYNDPIEDTNNNIYQPDQVKHTTVKLTEIFSNFNRLEASAFSIEAKVERDKVLNCKFDPTFLWSEGMALDCYYGGRAKRDYVDKNVSGAIGFIGSAEMLEVKPKPKKFLSSSKIDISQFKVNEGDILISRSGTIGNVTFVNKTLEKNLISEHAIRLIPKEYGGYIYAYLKTKTGKILVKANTFGAVVDQIEPEHLKKVLIPNADVKIKKEIHDLIVKSFNLRDESNKLIDNAEALLYKELNLPNINSITPKYFSDKLDVKNFSVKLSSINLRLEATYNNPIINEISTLIRNNSAEVLKIGNEKISSNIILPGRFKRVYVDEENGTPFFGGKQLLELSPSNIKYLSKNQHKDLIKNKLLLSENMIAITCSGTIGKINIIPRHWENWTLNQHVLRIVPVDNNIAGYLFCWLNSDFGYELIVRNNYGAVIDEIDDKHISDIEVPIIKNKESLKKINDMVLKANKLRYQAYTDEITAINQMNNVINS